MLGLVVQELGSAVEERRVVFVPLEDEVAAGSSAVPAAEVHHLAADQETGIPARIEEEPGEKGGRRRLTMRSRDHDGGLAGQQVLLHRLWQREDRKASPVG